MDSERFDRITRALATGQSRRGVLKGLTGTAIGGLLTAVGIGGQAASAGVCKAEGKACKKNDQCCSNNCVGSTGGSTGKSEGTCQAPEVCTLPLNTPCETADQCCSNNCGPVDNLFQSKCCRPLGAACPPSGALNECCATVFEGGGSVGGVSCAPGGTCGGLGATCGGEGTCAAGLKCDTNSIRCVAV